MSVSLADSNRRFSFSCETLDSGASLEVVSFEGEEALSELYRFDLLLASSDSGIDEYKLVGQTARFRLNDGTEGCAESCYSGVIESFEQLHRITGWTFYRAKLVPRLWFLARYFLNEVYTEHSPLELFDKVISDAGLTHDDYALRIVNQDKFPKGRFIFQFQEHYLDFLSRWCERLGIYWWFEERQEAEIVVLGNDRNSHDTPVLQMFYRETDGLAAPSRIYSFNMKLQSLPRQVTVMDHFYKKSSLEIKGIAPVDKNGIGEIVSYDLHINTNEAAQALARIRAEGLICRSREFTGESAATGMRCGYWLELRGHYRNSFNQRYLLTRICHRGSQAALLLEGLGVPASEAATVQDFYQASFNAIPADVQFRPEIVHPWPKIEGNLTAYIDAQGSGEYAELNEHGEYKVQLPYDVTQKEPEKASAWMRMARPYAGEGYGMNFPLHKGTEVMLSFHKGNPDEPVIIGALHNSLHPDVVCDENQTQSVIRTAGQNSIEFNDEEGKQGIYLYSPTCNTRVSLGAPPSSAKAVGADSSDSSSDSQSGASVSTDGHITINAKDYSININGFYEALYAGNYATQYLGFSTTGYYGATLQNYIGASATNYIGATSTNSIGATSEIYIGAYLSWSMGLSWEKETIKFKDCDLELNTTIAKVEKIQSGIESIGTSVGEVGCMVTAVSARVDTVAAEVKEVDAHMTNVAAGVTTIDIQVQEVAASIKSIDAQVHEIDASVLNTVTEIWEVAARVEDIDAKVSSVSAAMQTGTYIFM
ncbi:type VI secretion system tip protein VgrG [Candidatus Methylospira mobilis]|uniref:Type VI secretion system tip protein VgrG n=1 Tax=Candidatus Methylospira mobilis TaxID=1808979 RepID=A0A5Q0BL67_9GAMM|nr:type VI secretion system tip protein TssI/VgrG [Candidatus Methylospira mobilis]QFY44583.1 type VI secretion system tip protein VgrG [Candidatus Methylospira mobilis]